MGFIALGEGLSVQAFVGDVLQKIVDNEMKETLWSTYTLKVADDNKQVERI